MVDEHGRALPDRVVDQSWKTTPGPMPPPPEWEEGLWALDAAVRTALAGDWSPYEIASEVQVLARSYSP